MGVLSEAAQYHCHCSSAWSRISLQVLLSVFSTMAVADSRIPIKLSNTEETSLKVITQGTNKFAIDLYRALSSKASGNVFVSPLSAQIVLAQAYLGAKETTAEELAQLLSLPKTPDDTLSGYSSLIKVLKDPVLNLANRIFVEASANIKADFQKNIEKYFLTSAEAVDFQNSAESARSHINNWIEEQTNKKIKELLPPNSVSSDTLLVLTNAIHFKANWKKVFSERRTKEEPFHLSKSETAKVQMMHMKDYFAYTHDEELGAKILGMDYEGDNFRMVIILPDEIDGLANVEAKLAKTDVAEKIKGLKNGRTEVEVALPKFKLEETMVLNDILESMGAGTMFSPKANLTGITDARLYVSLVVQKSFVEVNEKGTEAAAATGMVCVTRCLVIKPPPEIFTADHPFIFLIYHQSADTLLFIGHYAMP